MWRRRLGSGRSCSSSSGKWQPRSNPTDGPGRVNSLLRCDTETRYFWCKGESVKNTGLTPFISNRLDTARASDKVLAEITVPKEAPTPASGWSDSDMMFAKTAALSTEVKVACLTIGRDEYKNAFITKRNPAEATIYHSTGVAVYPMERLGAGLQEQLGFDEKAAQAYRASRVQVTQTSSGSQTNAPEPRVYVRDYQTYVGPHGGVYHYSASGNKVYQRHRKSDVPDQN